MRNKKIKAWAIIENNKLTWWLRQAEIYSTQHKALSRKIPWIQKVVPVEIKLLSPNKK